MLIDWFTVGAQTLNFLILVWLLKRFLYKPILDAIDAREQRIAAELADADTKKSEALQERNEFQQKNAKFDRQHAARLSDMTDAVKIERQRLLDEVRQAADALTSQRMATLRNESNNLGQALRRRTQDEVFLIARKALKELASTSLEERLGEVFMRQLRALDDDAKAALAKALNNSAMSPALVRSAFELPQQQRAAIQNALNETFSAEIPIRFETTPDLIAGIELSAAGQKVAWSIAEYLAALEQGVSKLMKAQVEPEAAAKPETSTKPEIADKKTETATKPGQVQ